jgi:hypothetical protein
LVSISVRKWNPVVVRSTTNDQVREQVQLVPKAYLRDVESAVTAVYKSMDRWSLPFPIRGVRLLPVTFADQARSAFQEAREALLSSVEVMLTQYDVAVGEARLKLGPLFVQDDYPTADAIRESYDATMSVFSIADSPVEIEGASRVNDLLTQFYNEAYSSLVGEFQAQVQAMVDRLGSGGRIFASSVEKFRDFTERFRTLASTLSTSSRYSDLQTIQRLVDQARAALGDTDVETLRRDQTTREAVQDAMSSVLREFEATGLAHTVGVRKV